MSMVKDTATCVHTKKKCLSEESREYENPYVGAPPATKVDPSVIGKYVHIDGFGNYVIDSVYPYMARGINTDGGNFKEKYFTVGDLVTNGLM